MSTDIERDAPSDSEASTVVAVLLVIVSAWVVAGLTFDSAPWLDGIFGLVLLAIAWKLRSSRPIIPLIYTLFGSVFLILGIWITIGKAIN
jgi:hypothetical protein